MKRHDENFKKSFDCDPLRIDYEIQYIKEYLSKKF